MKDQTRHRYVQGIERAVALLQRAVDTGAELPDPGQLAEAAHLSAFHFHRIYRALTGETPGGTVLRLRLLRALKLLADPAQPVTDAALAVGYETPQAFARAFRQAYGASPSELRAQPERVAQAIEQSSRAPTPAHEAVELRVEVVSMEPFRVIAVRHRGAFDGLDRVYLGLFEWAATQGLVEHVAGVYGVPHGDHRDGPPEGYAFDCAVAFDRPAEPGAGLIAEQLGGGTWARYRHVGSFDLLDDATDALLAHWLPGSGRELRDLPFFHHYLDDPEQTPEALLRTDIYLPVA
ncbi:GyrI-like domain-containing protein [Dyella sp. LX-66]|uniref:AraC family transcriptional regulator n=1 Tax=unclassified Dyella TaxID=2634549 RepID=UPI001BE11A35|nr:MULTISPECIES: GyrI-like domain-containing protein [unclassified Dyella]MBT2117955.1 GyrI-like domain-containing protein [Dyella sp. LX-1]MBT2140862.1 GyrI-like domain-containing protein [Dyella sp. LX-66]